MNNIIRNENRLWYCDICDKTINFKSRVRHINSESQKQKEKYCDVVKEEIFFTPEIDQVDYILNDSLKDCRDKYFHTFKYKCVYIKFTNIRNDEQYILTITHRYKEFRAEDYRLIKKTKNARNNDFIFNEILKQTTKIHSNLLNTKTYYYLQHQIPISHRIFLRILSQNRGYIKTHCNDRNNLFRFACKSGFYIIKDKNRLF